MCKQLFLSVRGARLAHLLENINFLLGEAIERHPLIKDHKESDAQAVDVCTRRRVGLSFGRKYLRWVIIGSTCVEIEIRIDIKRISEINQNSLELIINQNIVRLDVSV
jgi:hypothetical protein